MRTLFGNRTFQGISCRSDRGSPGSRGQEPCSAGKRSVGSRLGSALLAAAVVTVGLVPSAGWARQGPGETASVALAQLPREAQSTHRLILSGGPFPYDKDGTTFGNRERLLPPASRGFYREYTVRTPGARNRGARRIVCGGKPPTSPDACYYTADHYASFQRIVP
jgi:ribonuclease T1